MMNHQDLPKMMTPGQSFSLLRMQAVLSDLELFISASKSIHTDVKNNKGLTVNGNILKFAFQSNCNMFDVTEMHTIQLG